MELRSILNSNAARVIKGIDQPRRYLPDIAKRIGDRYKFVKRPEAIEDFTGQALEFEYGDFFPDAVVTKLRLFNDGMLAEAPVATEMLDTFLDDVLATLGEIGISTKGATFQRFYVSTLDAVLRPGFSDWFDNLQPIVENVRASIEASGIGVSDYQVGGFSLVGEGPDQVKPPRFVLERRLEQALSSHIYYSQAPMGTVAHCKLLSDLEELF